MNKMVSVIIVNWNGINYLSDCLSSLFEQEYKRIEVILVDNNSSDGSAQFVAKNFPKVKIIINKKNLGFAEANNIGYRFVHGEYVLFLNNDTRVSNDFITELIKAIESKPEIAGAQAKILLMDKPSRLDSVGAFLTNSGFLYHYGIGKKNSKKYDSKIEIFSAKGACMIFKKEVLEKIKVGGELFDSKYFAYFEETDMCHRVWLANYKILYVPSSIIYHKMGGTSSKINNAIIQYHSYKNRINAYLKNLELQRLIYFLPIHLMVCELAAIFFLLKGKFKVFFAIQLAVVWNILTIEDTLKKRKIIQKRIRKVSDKFLKGRIERKVRLSYYYYMATDISKYEE